MNLSRSKLVAIITGFISILICLLYLILIIVFDFRSLLNNQISTLSEKMAVIFVEIYYHLQYLFY